MFASKVLNVINSCLFGLTGFISCVGAASSAHHFDRQLQFLQPADFDALSVASGRPACKLLVTEARQDQQQWYDEQLCYV